MDKSNEICINITKAHITEVRIDLSDGEKPRYTVCGSLTTDQGKSVSDFTFWNDTWVASDKKIEIPVEVHLNAADIFRRLKPVIYKKLNDEWPMLTRVSEHKDVEDGEVVESVEEIKITEDQSDDVPF